MIVVIVMLYVLESYTREINGWNDKMSKICFILIKGKGSKWDTDKTQVEHLDGSVS